MFLGDFLLNTGIWISLLFAIVGLAAAFYLVKLILAAPAGDGRMKQVASAIEEGAKAYLNRQVVSIGIIAVIIFILTAIFKGAPTAVGFLIGAVCSLAAGFIGMRIAVLANVRTLGDGFSVVAPISVIVPSSTCGRNASCCALLKRWISSTKRIVRLPS